MKSFPLPGTGLSVSRIAYGCMQIGGTWNHDAIPAKTEANARACVEAAVDEGINFFDHADIYTCGKSETVFGRILKAKPALRDAILLQSKVGIRFAGDAYDSGTPNRYDFSHDHIVGSTEAILKRLGVDHLDILLLHRPDPLVEPEEVARAFDALHAAGKVRHFGVSNHTPGQIEVLKRALNQPIVVNQLELSLKQPALVVEGFMANRAGATAEANLSSGTLDYCRLNNILVQAWSPLGGGKLVNDDTPAAKLTAELARAKDTTPEAIHLAWILRLPNGIQPVIGTTKPERIRAAAEGDRVTLTRQEWYALLAAARGANVP